MERVGLDEFQRNSRVQEERRMKPIVIDTSKNINADDLIRIVSEAYEAGYEDGYKKGKEDGKNISYPYLGSPYIINPVPTWVGKDTKPYKIDITCSGESK